MGLHPCQSCGACCASFRVQFYWREANAEEAERSVPAHLFEELDSQSRCMKGTGRKHRPKCEALKGRIGEEVGCTIYQDRPTPCRAFKASFEDGEPHIRCDEARSAHGIAPLRMVDWRLYRAGKALAAAVTAAKREADTAAAIQAKREAEDRAGILTEHEVAVGVIEGRESAAEDRNKIDLGFSIRDR